MGLTLMAIVLGGFAAMFVGRLWWAQRPDTLAGALQERSGERRVFVVGEGRATSLTVRYRGLDGGRARLAEVLAATERADRVAEVIRGAVEQALSARDAPEVGALTAPGDPLDPLLDAALRERGLQLNEVVVHGDHEVDAAKRRLANWWVDRCFFEAPYGRPQTRNALELYLDARSPTPKWHVHTVPKGGGAPATKRVDEVVDHATLHVRCFEGAPYGAVRSHSFADLGAQAT